MVQSVSRSNRPLLQVTKTLLRSLKNFNILIESRTFKTGLGTRTHTTRTNWKKKKSLVVSLTVSGWFQSFSLCLAEVSFKNLSNLSRPFCSFSTGRNLLKMSRLWTKSMMKNVASNRSTYCSLSMSDPRQRCCFSSPHVLELWQVQGGPQLTLLANPGTTHRCPRQRKRKTPCIWYPLRYWAYSI